MNDSTAYTANATAVEGQPSDTVVLESPLTRGEQTLTSFHLRRPSAGELRGIKLQELMQMDVASLALLLPRISTPTLTANDVNNLDPVDLVAVATVVSRFFLSKAQKASLFA
ncbi:phage tail assembly protein [Stenotrophomonas sp. B1-1]|uniref:phage tail assembly protein n=1 Tax=Stenotrophomonas sp. B1-1 TaxID=2710648 RepID=UPI0013DD0CCD|nr:phage tail assembly protein [Stenotrophomonas sp. B1-1]